MSPIKESEIPHSHTLPLPLSLFTDSFLCLFVFRDAPDKENKKKKTTNQQWQIPNSCANSPSFSFPFAELETTPLSFVISCIIAFSLFLSYSRCILYHHPFHVLCFVIIFVQTHHNYLEHEALPHLSLSKLINKK